MILFLAVQWLAAPAITEAQAVSAAGDAPPLHHRPRVGLVLSGGGARGAAHVGVLKVLEQLRVPVDAIAGTSMGAVVGGLYASGLSARDIEKIMTSINWQDAFRDRPPREDLDLRRKEEDENYLVKFPLGVRDGHIVLPKGLIQGQRLTETLRRLTLPVARITNFDDLPTPLGVHVLLRDPWDRETRAPATTVLRQARAPACLAARDRDLLPRVLIVIRHLAGERASAASSSETPYAVLRAAAATD